MIDMHEKIIVIERDVEVVLLLFLRRHIRLLGLATPCVLSC